MRLAFALLAMVLGATAANADAVTVRTGEHATFTRVVLFVPNGVDWRVGRSTDGYVVRLPVVDGYDLDSFFDVIPKSRITGVSQRSEVGELELAVSCRCNANAYLFREGILVIDIGDGPPQADSPTETMLDAPPLPVPPEASAIWGEGEVRQEPIIPLFPGQDDQQHASAKVDATSPVQEGGNAFGAPPDVISSFEDQIAQALGEGLTGRLLEKELPLEVGKEDIFTEVVWPGSGEIENLPGIMARSSIDPITGQGDPSVAKTQTGRQCLPDALFAVHSWGDERPFNVQIGAARLAIYQEFDRVDDVAVTKLAQTFIYFGFGQEALQTLQLDRVQSRHRRYLADLARLIDGRGGVYANFKEQVSCPSSVALWALLASEGNNLDGPVARDAILISFKELPPTLQATIGPRLSRAFVQIGDLDASSQILSRSQFEPADAADSAIATSAFAAAIEDEARAIQTLEDILFNSPRATPELMARYFEAGISAGRMFRGEDFALGNALRFQAAGSSGFNQLTAAQIRAHLSMDQFDEALGVLHREGSQLPEALRDTLERQFVAAAVDRMEVGAFGRFAWSDDLLPTAPELRVLISERLWELGFPDRAMQVAATGPIEDLFVQADGTGREQAQDDRFEAFADRALRRSLFDGPQIAGIAGQGPLAALTDEAEVITPVAGDGGTLADDVVAWIIPSAEQAPVSLKGEPRTGITLREGRDLIAQSQTRRQELGSLLQALAIPESP